MTTVHAPRLGEPTVLPTYEERWDAFGEVLTFTQLGKGRNIPEVDAIAADAETLYRDDDAPPMRDIDKLRRRIWALPAEVRKEILNGWRWDPPADRLNRQQLEMREAHEAPLRQGLLIEAFLSKPGGQAGSGPMVEESFQLWHSENMSPLRLQLAVGTSRDEALKLLDAIKSKIESNWDAIISDYPSQRLEYAEIADRD